MTIFAVVAVAIVVAHLSLGLHVAARARAEWDDLGSDGHLLTDVGDTSLAVAFDAASLDSARVGIAEARETGQLPEAARLLGLAYAVVAEAHPDRQDRLRAMGKLLRMAAAIRPMPSLAPGDFALTRLGLVAGLSTVAHHLLIAPAERFALRLSTLRLGFWLAFGVLTRAHRTISAQPDRSRAWRTFDAGAADWKVLDREHLESFRVFVAALRNVQRAA